MNGPQALLAYLAEASHWQGVAGIPTRIAEHVVLAGLAVLVAALLALPLGCYIGHTGRFGLLGANVANIGRAIPSYAVMVMVFPVALAAAEPLGYDPRLGLTFLPIFVAMTLLAIPPMLVSTFTGIGEVDRDVVGASAAMGLTGPQVLRQVELPLALPVIVGGLRVATLQVIATATLGAILSGGGLGRFIIDGLARRDEGMLFTGVVLVAGLAIGTDLVLAGLQRVVTPRGVSVAAGGQAPEVIGDLGAVGPPALRRP